MKEWVKNLTGEEMAEIYSWKHLWEDTTKEFDEKIFKMIDESQYKRKEKKPAVKRLLLVAILITVFIVPGLFITNNLQNSNQLLLAKTVNHVTFTMHNETVQLKQGDRIKKDTRIQTMEDSACNIQYAEKATLKIYEGSEIAVTENNKSLISFMLDAGKIYISENINKDTRIAIFTQNAYIYATGTLYSVEYKKAEDITIIKTFEGTVHIVTIPGGKVFDLKAGEEIIINQEQVLTNQSGRLTGEKEWSIKTVYFNPNAKEPIIGFDVFKDFITATTKHSVICFAREENYWEDNIKDIIISPPVIFNERVYISTKDTIFCYGLYSETRERDIKPNEKMGVGQRMIEYDNNLYIIFPSGIYLFDNIHQEIETTPFIYVIEATLPVFFNNRIYITSSISRNVEAYDITGELLWSISLNDSCSHSPVLIDDYLYIASKKNTLYKVTLSGRIVSQKQIEGTIESVISDKQFLYVNTRRNRLFKVDHQTLYGAGFYDNIETPFSHNNMLLLGEKDGSIRIITIDTKKELKLRNSFVTVFANHETDYYAGLNNGYIMRINEE